MSRLDFIFGAETSGETALARARGSSRRFVRSQLQLAEDSETATGRRLTAAEAQLAFGEDLLEKVAEDGSVPLVRDPKEPAATIKARRQFLRLSHQSLAAATGASVEELKRIEKPGTISSQHLLDRVGQFLALDERVLSAVPMARADIDLATRLRELNSDGDRDDAFILSLTEASWIVRRQHDLMTLLEIQRPLLKQFERGDPDYDYPTFRRGYNLAARTRAMIDLDPSEPIHSVYALVEDTLGVVLVNTDLGTGRAGATITNGDRRGIALTCDDANANVLIRRMTLAHELGHLLWDTRGNLERVRVESSRHSTGRPERDPVEMRANAFAVTLLAPASAVEEIAATAKTAAAAIARIVDDFGIHPTAAARHMANVCHIDFASIDYSRTVPSAVQRRWKDAERRPDRFGAYVRESRAGRFAELVLTALARGLITRDSARTWLLVNEETLEDLTNRAS